MGTATHPLPVCGWRSRGWGGGGHNGRSETGRRKLGKETAGWVARYQTDYTVVGTNNLSKLRVPQTDAASWRARLSCSLCFGLLVLCSSRLVPTCSLVLLIYCCGVLVCFVCFVLSATPIASLVHDILSFFRFFDDPSFFLNLSMFPYFDAC